MLTAPILLTVLLGSAPGTPPTDIASRDTEPICASVPPAPERIDAQPFATTAADGTRSWGATATYRISNGQTGEAFMVITDDGSGEAQLMVDGEIIGHAAITLDDAGSPMITQWLPNAVNQSPEVIAEMMMVDLPAVLSESIPQEFKCSKFGRKVMKAGRYMAGGLLAATTAACCIASQGAGCVVCAAGAWTANEAIGEFADGYCD